MSGRRRGRYRRLDRAERAAIERGVDKGGRVDSVPTDACPRLLSWPHVCNGCNKRRYHCSRPWRCEYSAARAQHLADGLLSDARRGVDRSKEEFAAIAAKIRADLARGLSPAQIAAGRAGEFSAAPSTIYRWIERGYAGMSNMDLRRKVGYKERRRGPAGATAPSAPSPPSRRCWGASGRPPARWTA